ncbi:hypothetical protein [Saccharothrix sp. HUAS TT1]|uniref:hypothetical protein n=1 Tax=unclassified Saccharothrix TaxID=2593673 RepID=UPI00345C3C67
MWIELGRGRGHVWSDRPGDAWPWGADTAWDVVLGGVVRVPHEVTPHRDDAQGLVARFQSREPLFRDVSGVVLTEVSVHSLRGPFESRGRAMPDSWQEEQEIGPVPEPPAGDGLFPPWTEVVRHLDPAADHRFVTLVVAAHHDRPGPHGVHDPGQAAAAGLELTRDGQAGETPWLVWDRRTRVLHRVEQADVDGAIDHDRDGR